MSKPYILTWRSDIDPGSIKIVGPFETSGQACAWGRVWQKAHQDNPCWQEIWLDDPAVWTSRSENGDVDYLMVRLAAPGTPEASR